MTTWLIAGLTIATFVSEDAALLSAAGLARAGSLPVPVAAATVALGIWLGDAGLFAAGRLARRWAPVSGWVARRWTPDQLSTLEARLARGAPLSILLSRFTPGTRLPLYVAAGVARVPAALFLGCTAAAAAAWAGTVVAGAAWLL